ncbi:MAG: hypothetical protein OXJ90_12060, partial [Spirochaetaceae bacterium]|nr:hypothetical protein [Spirochaetaceae bacterium]
MYPRRYRRTVLRSRRSPAAIRASDCPARDQDVLGLERDQQLGDFRRQPPGPTEVGAPLRIQGIEAAAPVVL